MWWGGFSEWKIFLKQTEFVHVLIPMWWGGFSESSFNSSLLPMYGLNPHVVGRFFRVVPTNIIEAINTS